MKASVIIAAIVAAFGLVATAPNKVEEPNKVVWQLVVEDIHGEEWVLDTLANMPDCWEELNAQGNRSGMACERTLVVGK